MRALLTLVALAVVGTVFYALSRMTDTTLTLLVAVLLVAVAGSIAALPAVAMTYFQSRRDRASEPGQYIEQPRQQSYYQDAKQEMDLELRRLKLESARARMLPSANPTTPPAAADTYEWPAARQPTAHRVITIGDDDE